jgi:hypothetical protein
MLRFIALVAVTGALSLPPFLAHAQTGYGVKPGAPSTSTFDRRWNSQRKQGPGEGRSGVYASASPGDASLSSRPRSSRAVK